MERKNDLLNITDLDPQLEVILNNFSSIFNIRIAYYLPDGREYKIGSNKQISDYCKILRKTLGYDNKCVALDSFKQKRAKETKCIQSYICHGGCNEVIKPVFSEDELLGYIMIGQAVSKCGIPDYILREAEKLEVLEETVATFNALPHYEKEKKNDIIQLFSELTDLVILKNLIKQKELGPVKKVVQYMRTTDSKISLKEAAELTNISESRLRHKFIEELGQTFLQVRNSICMEKAKKLLKEDQKISIQEVAFRLGYTDPLYFSKAFKKYFGLPPSLLRD